MIDCNSGFLDNNDIIGGYTSTFSDVEVIGMHDRMFFASATRHGRRWFLKGIRREFSDSTALRQQLLKEFEILSILSHPGVVQAIGMETVHELGPCIVMEWVEGVTLQDILAQPRLSRTERLQIFTEIAEAMTYVHSRGVVHRDLKPANIMVRDNGRKVVIIDFGLADTDQYTILKNPAGTEGYMSARQKSANTPFTGDDIYGLGVIMQSLYPEYRGIIQRCTCTGKKGFANAGELLKAIHKRRRLKRHMLYTCLILTALSAALVILALLMHSRKINSSMTALESQLDSVSALARNERQQRLAMTDSLQHIALQLDREIESGNKVREHDALMQTTKLRLRDQLERSYLNFIKSDPCPSYEDPAAAVRLIKAMASAKEALLATIPQLKDSDRETLENAYALYQGDILQRWTEQQKTENEK